MEPDLYLKELYQVEEPYWENEQYQVVEMYRNMYQVPELYRHVYQVKVLYRNPYQPLTLDQVFLMYRNPYQVFLLCRNPYLMNMPYHLSLPMDPEMLPMIYHVKEKDMFREKLLPASRPLKKALPMTRVKARTQSSILLLLFH